MWREAFRNLQATRGRSFLAVLGIAVGSAAFVALLAGGQMAERQTLKQFEGLGTHLLAIDLETLPPPRRRS